MNWDVVLGAKRVLLRAALRPRQGDRFQPTGFPDLGAATYTLPDGTEMLLVESAQSMANRLETVCWDDEAQDLAKPLRGMPYVAVEHNGRRLTNSLLEAHRLNSPYILESQDKRFFDSLKKELGTMEAGPISLPALARVVCQYDPGSLVHGLFLAKKDLAGGRLRLPRLLSAFVEARDVRAVESGGVKLDRVDPGANANLGFGNVPYSRTEYAARSITAYFNLDLAMLRSYRLGEPAEKFIAALSFWKIASFLDRGLRLRTACELECAAVTVDMPQGLALPDLAWLSSEMPGLIGKVEGFARPSVTTVVFDAPANWKAKAKKGQSDEDEPAGGSEEEPE